jgi:hypothetical protein
MWGLFFLKLVETKPEPSAYSAGVSVPIFSNSRGDSNYTLTILFHLLDYFLSLPALMID